MSSVETENLKPYKCIECPKSFKHRAGLWQHKQLHKPDKNHVCDICGKKFKLNTYLTIHKRVHEEPKYECKLCNKKYKHMWYKNQHEKEHFDSIKHECEICKKLFKHSRILECHMITHTPSKFGCEICQKKFNCNSHLKRHMVVHDIDRKYYNCYACNRKFKTFLSLSELIKKLGIFDCEKCEKQFHKEKVFIKHMKEHEPKSIQIEHKCKCNFCEFKAPNNDFIETHMSYDHLEEYLEILKERNGIINYFESF